MDCWMDVSVVYGWVDEWEGGFKHDFYSQSILLSLPHFQY